MDAKFTNEVVEVLEKRGLKKEDVADVVESNDGRMLTKDGKNLAKKRVGGATVYALFDDDGNVESAYSHRMELKDIVKTTDEPEMSDWTCRKCGERAEQGTANMMYMNIVRSGPAIVCPKCGDSWIEEYMAIKTIAAAEGLFEKKKG